MGNYKLEKSRRQVAHDISSMREGSGSNIGLRDMKNRGGSQSVRTRQLSSTTARKASITLPRISMEKSSA